jgi:hypothetical protein
MELKNKLRRIRKKILAPFDRSLRRMKIAAERFVIKTISKHGMTSHEFSGANSGACIQAGTGTMHSLKQMFAFIKANQRHSFRSAEPFQAVPLGDGLVLVSHPHVVHMYADMSDAVLLPKLVVGNFEELTTIALETTLLPGDTVLHFGSEQGYHLLTIAHLIGPTGHIIAMEDQFPPRTIELNVRSHQLESRVTVVADSLRLIRAIESRKATSRRCVIFVSDNGRLDPVSIPELVGLFDHPEQAIVIEGSYVSPVGVFEAQRGNSISPKLASAA